ncbi:M20 aminoacylase family protein [Paracoccus sp. (in: a-proteobacteria)]|uniref:M20 aminoacylase family protein n=1 Tax=Paracoccus sp. TaxID=267 RepID=UPI003A88CEAA
MPVRNRFAQLDAEITGWRRDLHAHPETGFDTPRSSALIAGLLRDFGCDEVVQGIGRTGVVATIAGAKGDGPVIGLRADFDALPITETSGAAHASCHPGKMHGCGHDGHTAMLLGAAKVLAETRSFAGTVVLIFQPAEEIAKGASAMLADGILERFGISELYGMHNRPGLPVGQFAIRSGPFFAAVDTFEIAISGKGGHAARPHSCVDPIVAAAYVVGTLQTVVSRQVNPVEQLVISITSFQSATDAFNVIPDSVTLRGTARSFTPELRALAETRIHEIAQQGAALHGASASIQWFPGCPAMVNADAATGIAAGAARVVTGQEPGPAPLIMGGEDFAFMLEARPGAYILVGNGDTPEVHHPDYDFNDAAIPFGCSYWLELVERRLAAT